MRDPAAALQFEGVRVVRRLREPLSDEHFLRSDLAARWVDQGSLVPYRIEGVDAVVAERLPFISHPYEWCDSQLHRAAEFTLALQEEAVAAGYDLKDASAWNVLFSGTKPVFCDLMSFEPLRDRKWWAMGQFARHFLLPLALSKQRGFPGHRSFLAWRDGVPTDAARTMLGPGRFLTRYWPLAAGATSPDRNADSTETSDGDDVADIARFRGGLHASIAWMLKGCKPARTYAMASYGTWANYTDERDHYQVDSMALKQNLVDTWLRCVAPGWVLDLGCNTGEFSRVALTNGAQVVAIDADHDAIQHAFDQAGADRAGLHLVLASLDDMAGGRGWAGREHAGLAERLEQRFDVVLMLALIHHLAIAVSVPLAEVAAFAARCTAKWLIVEFLDETDPQLRSLCRQRLRDPAEFSLDRQRAAFLAAGFQIEAEASLAPAHRRLALLKRAL